jgi:WD40 repeat protein
MCLLRITPAMLLFLLAIPETPAADPLPDGAVLRLGEDLKGTVSALGISTDGKTIATWGTSIPLRVWDAETGKERYHRAVPGPDANTIVTTPLGVFSADGTLLAFGCDDLTLRVWDVVAGKEKRVLHFRRDGAYGRPYCLAFAPDSKTLASYSERDGCLRLWDVASGDELEQLELPQTWRTCAAVAFTGDGRTLGAIDGGLESGHREAVALWDTASGRRRGLLEGQSRIFLSLGFTPDGRTLLLGGAEGLRLFETLTGRQRARFAGKAASLVWALAPDGRLLALQEGKAIRLLDLRLGKEVARFRGHERNVDALAFTRDGRRLVSGSGDGTALVWDVTGR